MIGLMGKNRYNVESYHMLLCPCAYGFVKYGHLNNIAGHSASYFVLFCNLDLEKKMFEKKLLILCTCMHFSY